MPLKFMGKKLGMTNLFDDKGDIIPCTVISVEPNVVVQVKTKETDGYTAIQTGCQKITTKSEETLQRRVTKPLRGHFQKAGVQPHRYLQESKIENPEAYTIGQEIGIDVFANVAFVDITGTSIGKGFQGVMKQYNFGGMRATHGTGPVHRSAGSTGNRSTPGRTFPGRKRPTRMGGEQVTVQNLKVIQVDTEEKILVIQGCVPGPRNGLVTIRPAVKKGSAKS